MIRIRCVGWLTFLSTYGQYYQELSSEEKADQVMETQDDFFAQMQAAMEAGQSFMEAYKDRANRYGWDLWDRRAPPASQAA